METTNIIDINQYHFLTAENKSLRIEIHRLKEQIEWFRRQVFGKKSERFVDLPGNTPDLPGLVIPEAEPAEEAEVAIPAHRRKKQAKGKGLFTVDIPEDLPRVVEVIDIPEEKKVCPETGEKLVEIGRDVTEKLAHRPSEYYVKRIERPKYANPGNALAGVIQEPASDCIIEGSKFDPSFMAHVVTEKFAYHMPLNRIQEKLACRQIGVSRQVLSSLLCNIGGKLVPLCDLMREKMLAQGNIFTDDTPVALLVRDNGKTVPARMWAYIGGQPNAPPYHLYEFSENRSEIHPLTYLKDFKGIVHADAFSAYEKLGKRAGIIWAACWAHARRKYEEAQSGSAEFRREVLRQMRYLFLFERVAWLRSSEERLRIRQEKEKPIVDRLFALLKAKVVSGELLPKSSLAEAIGYMLTREQNFRNYLDHPDARMDNNIAERALRKLVIGRKNWLFVGSKAAGRSMAVLLSLVQTCRAMEIDPEQYLEDIFKRLLSHPAKKLEELLPDQWLAARDLAGAGK